MAVSRVEMEQKDRIKSFAINRAPYESRTRLFRLKSRVDANDSNGYFDSSCNVPGMEDQRLRSESKRGLMLNLTRQPGAWCPHQMVGSGATTTWKRESSL
jgi:hypothetical protein